MLTQDDLLAIGALIKAEGERLDMKIETSLAFNKQAHAEIMETLVESNEVNGQEVKELKKRVQRLEEHTGLAKAS